jgi:hypothetical protein
MKECIKPLAGLLVAWALFFIMITGCSSCKQPDPKPVQNYTTLLVHIHSDIDTNEVNSLNTTKSFRNADGRLMKLDYAQLYMSNIRAIRTDGSIVTINDTVILKVIDNEDYTGGKIPSGNYKTVMFDIGIDSPVNHKDPHGYFSTNPLSLQPTSMWFGNTGKGYMALNIAGALDSSVAKKGSASYPFSYQIGSDALLQTVTMPDLAFTAVPEGFSTVHLMVDYGKLITGINVKTENKCATFDNPALAARIAKNIPSMFRYEML